MTRDRERPVVVCADDAGWDRASDDRIERLARAGRISAVSILVDGPAADGWSRRGVGGPCAVGLHLNLTWSLGGRSSGLRRLLVDAHLGRIAAAEVEPILVRQFERFEALLDRPPDFVDGHQHVHVLPGVRDALLRLLETRYDSARRPLVRVPRTLTWRGPKAASLNLLGADRLAAGMRARGWGTNRDFAGAYPMSRASGYEVRMRRWLATIAAGGLIMVHPGESHLGEHDEARAVETAYLEGPAWPSDRTAASVRLIPFTAEAWASLPAP